MFNIPEKCSGEDILSGILSQHVPSCKNWDAWTAEEYIY
jgi:hypothetical protein